MFTGLSQIEGRQAVAKVAVIGKAYGWLHYERMGSKATSVGGGIRVAPDYHTIDPWTE